jgi:hypothetical protein
MDGMDMYGMAFALVSGIGLSLSHEVTGFDDRPFSLFDED